jgi:uncharacterized membrane protein
MNDLEKMLGRVLRGGVLASSAALIAGLVLFASGSTAAGMRLLAIGVLILIGTPLARVVVSTIAYARHRDWTFVLLTLIVLGELVASIVAAVRG